MALEGTTIRALLESVKTDLVALGVFSDVRIVPDDSIGASMRPGAVPLALISDDGGEMDASERRYRDSGFIVTVIAEDGTDQFGETAFLKCLDLGHSVVGALRRISEFPSPVYFVGDTDVSATFDAGASPSAGRVLVRKSYRFSVRIRLAFTGD